MNRSKWCQKLMSQESGIAGEVYINPTQLPGDIQDDYEERAAILQYCGQLERFEAESQAFEEIKNRIKNGYYD